MSAESLVLFLAAAVAAGLVLYVRGKIRNFSELFFGTGDLLKGLKGVRDNAARTVPSLSGVTSLMLPQIQKDFPEFSWPETKVSTENMIRAFYTAVSRKDLSFLSGAGRQLLEAAELMIEDNNRSGITEHFEDIIIHNTVISDYRKENGLCLIRMQSAIGFLHYRTGDGEENAGGKEQTRTETRCNSELVYVQDLSKTGRDVSAVGLHCPNCGAPVKNLGQKTCAYCGAALVELNMRVWSLESVRTDENI